MEYKRDGNYWKKNGDKNYIQGLWILIADTCQSINEVIFKLKKKCKMYKSINKIR